MELRDAIHRLAAQKPSADQHRYQQSVQKMRTHIEQLVRDSKSENRRTQKRLQILTNQGAEELPIIGLDREWSHFYQAWTRLITSREQGPASDLLTFHGQIAGKLEKQRQRLQKLQEYSAQLRQSAVTTNATNSSHRIMRIQKVKEILQKFEAKLAAESMVNHDDKMELARVEAQQLTNQLADCNGQKVDVERSRKSLHEANQASETEVRKLEREADERVSAAQRNVDILRRSNSEAVERIEIMRQQAGQYHHDIIELGLVIRQGKALQGRVKAAVEIAGHMT
jgi:hypothetical protein